MGFGVAAEGAAAAGDAATSLHEECVPLSVCGGGSGGGVENVFALSSDVRRRLARSLSGKRTFPYQCCRLS